MVRLWEGDTQRVLATPAYLYEDFASRVSHSRICAPHRSPGFDTNTDHINQHDSDSVAMVHQYICWAESGLQLPCNVCEGSNKSHLNDVCDNCILATLFQEMFEKASTYSELHGWRIWEEPGAWRLASRAEGHDEMRSYIRSIK